MKQAKAKAILQALVNGIHPSTGETLSDHPVLQDADVLRALLTGVTALDFHAAREKRRAALPSNVGKRWTPEEEAEVRAKHAAGNSTEEIAASHGRSVKGIEARLEKLGVLPLNSASKEAQS
jgi:hypothetical protein